MSLVCSSRHSLYVWYSKRPRFTRRFSSSRFRIILPWMKKTLLPSLSRGTLTRTSWLTYLTVLARGNSWQKKKVRDLILEVTHHEISEKPQFMAYDAAWQRRTDYSRKSVAFEPDSWVHWGEDTGRSSKQPWGRRLREELKQLAWLLAWFCIGCAQSLCRVFKPACQQRKAALYCMEVWRGLSTKLSFWLNKNSSANLPTSSDVFAFCSSMNGWTSLRHRFDWFYSNCMWRVSRNFAVLTIPNNTACQCMFLSWAL